MEIKIKAIEEHDDGSITAEIFADADAIQAAMQYFIINKLKESVDEYGSKLPIDGSNGVD